MWKRPFSDSGGSSTGKTLGRRRPVKKPAPDARRKALRDVIANCIYGVDRNEMAVELCRINLWLDR